MCLTKDSLVAYWSNTDFSKFNETDVRENFISRLLYVLGYSKNTVHDVFTEESLKLATPFMRIGRKKIKIDYVPTVRLKSFWILEAKPGSVRQIEQGDILQAYLYAVHPEVQVPYIVLCNGWELQIYDVHNVPDWDKPVFKISNTDCAKKFNDLHKILSAESMLRFHRQILLSRIKDTFEVELDIKQLNVFFSDLISMKQGLSQRIEENQRQLLRDYFQQQEKDIQTAMKSASDDDLVQEMSRMDTPNLVSNEYYNRMLKAPPKIRTKMLRAMECRYLGRPRAAFRCAYLRILLKAFQDELPFERNSLMSGIESGVQDRLNRCIHGHLTYFGSRGLGNALCFLDREVCKLAAVLVKSGHMERMGELVQNYIGTRPIEENITQPMSVAREVVPLILSISETLWNVFSRDQEIEIYKVVKFIRQLTINIEKKYPLKSYPDDDNDLLGYEMFGDDADFLINATCNILWQQKKLLSKLKLDDETQRVIFSHYPERKAYIPKFDDNAYVLSDDDEKEYMQRIEKGIAFVAVAFQSIGKGYVFKTIFYR